MTIRRLGALLAGALLLAGLSSPAHALAPGGVTGRLIGPDGSPRGGALVRLLNLTTGSDEVSTTSAPDGTFSFSGAERPDKFAVQICQNLPDDPCVFPPENLDFVKLYVGPDEQEFTLPALTSYFVTDGSSPAVALGDVQLTKPGTAVVKVTNGLAFSYRRHVVVSSMVRPYTRSRLVYRGLAPGRHLVEAFGQTKFVTVHAGQTATTEISRRQPAVVGRVMLNGRPVRNSPLTLSGADDNNPSTAIHTATTGPDGRYAFRGLPVSTTPWRLRFGAEVSAKGTHALVPGSPHRLVKFTLTPGQTRTVDLVRSSARLGSVRLNLTHPPSDAIGRRAALLTTGGELVGNPPLHKNTAFVGGLAPGRYIVATKWSREGGLEQTDWSYVRVRAGSTAREALAPRTGPGRVEVSAPPGSQVFLTALFPGGPSSALREYAAPESQQVASPSGDTTFARVPTGSYRIYMSPYDDRPDETVVRQVGSGTTAVDLSTPSPEASIRGQLMNPATSQPWPWTRVVARTLDCNGSFDSGSEYLADGGFIVVDELHTGRYTCELVGFWYDRGTPYPGANSMFRPITGTYDVVSGEQLDRNFSVSYARRAG